jgi:aldose 1-epimerase
VGRDVVLRAGTAQVRVDAADGGRIVSLRVHGHELLGRAGAGVLDYGSFVMAPWAGRIRNGLLRLDGGTHQLPTPRTHPHAGHGLVVDRPWLVTQADADQVRLRCDLDERWPVPGRVEQHIALSADGIEQTVTVYAEDEPFPATIGWHPWWQRRLAGAEVTSLAALSLPVDGMLRRDAAGIPDGTVVPVPPGPWDDCFTGVHWPVRITWPGVLDLDIRSDAGYLVIYDEQDPAFCVEPQTGPPDGPNTDPHTVWPGAPLSATTTWSWRTPPPGTGSPRA